MSGKAMGEAAARLGRRCVSLVALAPLALAGCSRDAAKAGLRASLSQAALPGLYAWDAVHEFLDPHQEFTRAPEVRDHRTLAAQARHMLADLRGRFLVHEGSLLIMTTPPVEWADSCLWQGVYAAMTALHYRLDPTGSNRRYAEKAFDGLALLAGKGRPIARAVYPARLRTEAGVRPEHADGDWQWKEDASIDSASGWLFGCLVTLEFLPTRREAALKELGRFMDVLIANGYRLRDSDGRLTRWSKMGGAVFNSPTGMLLSLSGLKALARRPGGERYAREHAAFLAQGQDRWGAYASGPLLWRNMTTNHNIAHLALAAALIAEDDPARWRLYALGLARLERLTRKMGNSFWIYLGEWALARRPELLPGLMGEPAFKPYWAGRQKRLQAALTSMREWNYPASKRKRETRNSTRSEVAWVRWPLSGQRSPAQPLPLWQRPPADFVWQRSPYAVDGWTLYRSPSPKAFAPLDFLAAYTLGRLTGAIKAGH